LVDKDAKRRIAGNDSKNRAVKALSKLPFAGGHVVHFNTPVKSREENQSITNNRLAGGNSTGLR
jgi:hypothetical protein